MNFDIKLPKDTPLKEYRKKTGLTQKEVADKLNITQTGYGKYELGKSEPDINTLIELSKLFHTTIDNLVGNSQNETIILNNLPPIQRETLERLMEFKDNKDWYAVHDFICSIDRNYKKAESYIDYIQLEYDRYKDYIDSKNKNN